MTTGRQIAVTSIRGGSGKSTVAALLGTTYAHYRQDPVLFLEADPALGSLPLRLGAESLRWTTGDIADIVKPDMSLLDVTGYLVQLPDNAWLLPASQGQIGAMLDSRAYERAVVALRRYFGVTVVDCETLPAEVARTALAAAQARVLTAPATPGGRHQHARGPPVDARAAPACDRHHGRRTHRTRAAHRRRPRRGRPAGSSPLGRACRSCRTTGIWRPAAPSSTELLAQATREAAARLAAEVFQLSLPEESLSQMPEPET